MSYILYFTATTKGTKEYWNDSECNWFSEFFFSLVAIQTKRQSIRTKFIYTRRIFLFVNIFFDHGREQALVVLFDLFYSFRNNLLTCWGQIFWGSKQNKKKKSRMCLLVQLEK